MMRKKTHCHFCGAVLTEKHLEGSLRLYCERCGEPIYENPVPATCLVVADGAGRLLLVKRSVAPKIGFWCLPGGFVELGEAPDSAAVRELKEETGLAGRIERLLGVTTSHSDRYHSVLMIGYLVRSFTGHLAAGDDASAVAWFSFDRLPDIAFDSHVHFIQSGCGVTGTAAK